MSKYILILLLLLSLAGNAGFLGFVYLKREALFNNNKATETTVVPKTNAVPAKTQDNLFDETNPTGGVDLGVSLGNLGPKMITGGVIDLTKFKSAYASSGSNLSEQDESTLTEGTTEKLKITGDNSYFLLNFFWAVGLYNKSKILTGGEMMSYGGSAGIGNFASTGGWTLGKDVATKYYGKGSLIKLTVLQEALVAEVASNIYRPCCNNSTAFPDCNHGMALLGLLELMASQGSSKDQMYTAAKYVNAYWFPGNYYDLARYFRLKEGKRFADIDAKILLSKEYSSAQGSQNVKKWLVEKGVIEEPPASGRGCGV